MRLIKLITENFKKLGNFSAEFKDGLNIIAGENFQGKTTLLQAIEAAFFGTGVVPVKKENIPTWGQNNFKLELWFALDEGDVFYVVTRNKSTAKLIRHTSGMEPELIANGNTPVTAEIEKLLGLAARDYNLFVQSKQGESSGILTFGATALNRKVEEFAGVDMIDKVQAEAQRRATSYSGKADAKGVSAEDMEVATLDWNAAKTAVSLAEEAVKDAKALRDGAAPFAMIEPQPAAQLRAAAQFASELANQLERAESSKAVAAERVTESQARFDKLALICVDSLQEELDSLQVQGTALKDEVKVLEDQDGEYTRASNNLLTTQSAYNELYAEYIPDEDQAGLDQAQTNLEIKKAELTQATELVGTTKAAHSNLTKLATGAKCPTCGHAKEDHDPAKLEAEAEAARVAMVDAQTAVKKLNAEITEISGMITLYSNKLTNHSAASSNLRAAEVALAAAKPVDLQALGQKRAAHEEVRGAWAAANQKLKTAADNNKAYRDEEALLKTRKEVLQSVTGEVADLDQQWADLPEPPTAAEVQAAEQAEIEYRTASEAWKENNTKLINNVAMATNSHELQVKLLASAEDRLAGYNKRNDEARDDLLASQKYARLVQFLRTRRQEYMKDVWDTIMAISSKLVRVSSKDSITQLTNDDGDFHFTEDGVSAPTSSASGAQKAFIGTSVKVGLARALYGSESLLIFDEPTESCSEQYAGSMAAMIASSARQVLLITHRENDQALADHVINVGE